jgi:hypothetical protein
LILIDCSSARHWVDPAADQDELDDHWQPGLRERHEPVWPGPLPTNGPLDTRA